MQTQFACAIGMLAALGAGVMLAAGALPAGAQTLPPRPTVEPTAMPTGTPSATPTAATPAPSDSAASGRITGTVINLATGTPASSIAVQVGDGIVFTDANGNYDRSGLAPGNYVVVLALPPASGEPARSPLTINLTAGATVVQHLTFGQAPTLVLGPTPVPLPIELPATGGEQGTWFAALLAAVALLVAGAGLRRMRRSA